MRWPGWVVFKSLGTGVKRVNSQPNSMLVGVLMVTNHGDSNYHLLKLMFAEHNAKTLTQILRFKFKMIL